MRKSRVFGRFSTFGAAAASWGAIAAAQPDLAEWRGVDLSYVNELADCGATWRASADAGLSNPNQIFADAGANIVRLRLWHTPDWTDYSTLPDVKKSIAAAKAAGMKVLLDFHYSDDWVHPGQQIVPAAWSDLETPQALADALADYTTHVLDELAAEGLLPAYVQVGNETNTDMLIKKDVPEDAPVDWARNSIILKAGLSAVRAAADRHSAEIGVMLHIAQPENVIRWFDGATEAGVTDFDLIGISYYPKWSSTAFSALPSALAEIKNRYGKDLVIVETAYPWTLGFNDDAGNLLGADSLVEGYPASPDGQRRFMADLHGSVLEAGGLGTVYWEPAWVSSSCKTRWATGSHWENAALFDFDGVLLPAAALFDNNKSGD